MANISVKRLRTIGEERGARGSQDSGSGRDEAKSGSAKAQREQSLDMINGSPPLSGSVQATHAQQLHWE